MNADLLEVPTLDLDEIHDHTANPRRDAVADDELVESVRAAGIHQPLIVAPAVDGNGWVLIDGHRRKNAAARAGLTTVPVSPRYDLVTDAQQIEVMAVTGLTQAQLTPVEEAAAYEQLALLGMDETAIAAATGFTKRRVKERLKLNSLSTGARDAVHAGDVTLVDVAALEEFENDHEAHAELERHLGTPNFRSVVHQVRSRRERQRRNAAEQARLERLGAVEVDHVPGGGGMYRDQDGDRTTYPHVKRLYPWMPDDLGDAASHDGHLGWRIVDGPYADVEAWCLDTTAHPEWDAAPAPRQDDAEWAKKQAEREAERERLAAADHARREWLTEHLTGLLPTKSHQGLAALAGPYLVAAAHQDGDEPPADLGTPTRTLAAFAAHLAGQVAEVLDQPAYGLRVDSRDEALSLLQLWDAITAAGYPMSDVDVEYRTRIETALTELDDEAADG